MRLIAIFLIASSLSVTVVGTARAEILIKVDKSTQRMTVVRDGAAVYNWPVSTGRTGCATPSGSYTAFRMEADHYSKEWDDAPMPHSIFFTKIGHAIHGSYDTKKLGMPASHGCVRISPVHAATLFALVKQDGLVNTKVVLTGSEQAAPSRTPESCEAGLLSFCMPSFCMRPLAGALMRSCFVVPMARHPTAKYLILYSQRPMHHAEWGG